MANSKIRFMSDFMNSSMCKSCSVNTNVQVALTHKELNFFFLWREQKGI